MGLTSTIQSVIIGIIALIIGLGIGGLAMWGIQRVKVAEAERMKTEAILAKNTMQKQWEAAVNELNSTRVVLNDTLAALELLRQYQRIDNATRQNIDSLKNSLKDGNITPETKNLFKSYVDDFNKLNGNTQALTGADEIPLWDLKPFVKLHDEAEALFKKTEIAALEVGLNLKEVLKHDK